MHTAVSASSSLPNTQDLMLLLQEKKLDSSQTPTKSTPLFTVLKK